MFWRIAKQRALIAAVLVCLSLPSFAVRVGDSAPAFDGVDSHGKHHSLAEYKGKFVVLEWHNQGCPYTKKHYASGNMQALQKQWTEKDVVWFTVISSAPGQQGYVTAAEENEYLQKSKATPTAALLDPDGQIAHLYDAKTTPHMFVIDPGGKLIYEGAIDDNPSSDPAVISQSKNYVSEALSSALQGKPITTPYSRPYGCSIKYAH